MKPPALSKTSVKLLYVTALALLAVTFCVCVSVGSVNLPVSETIAVFIDKLFHKTVLGGYALQSEQIVMGLRAPRVLLTMFVGAGLSVAGAVMQGLIKNPLADGSVLGVSAGGSLGAVLTIFFGITTPFLPELSICLVAIVFSMLSLLFILSFAYAIDRNLSSNTIILSGVIFTMFLSGIVSIITSFSHDKLKGIVFWSMGSFSGRGFSAVAVAAVFITAGIVAALCLSRELDAFSMGEEQARYVGVNVKRVRLILLVCVAVLCGTSVSLAGNIAFVGLIIPHMMRMVFGPVHIRLLPFSMFGGAVFLSLCDLIARTVIAPVELPVGVVTSVFGSLVFIYIFYQSRKRAKE